MSRVSFVSQRFYLYNLLNRYFELKYVPKSTAQTNKNCKFIMKSLINSPLPKKTRPQSLPLFKNLQSQLVQSAPRLSRLLLARAATCLEKLKIGKSSNLQFCVSAAHICPLGPPKGERGEKIFQHAPFAILIFTGFIVFECIFVAFFSPF